MKHITLTKGMVALIDDSDYEELSRYKWHAVNTKGDRHYANRSEWDGRRKQNTTMHRHLLGLVRGDVKVVDHIDGNTLNNTRANLRVCTPEENRFNQAGRRNKPNGLPKGVFIDTRSRKYLCARIGFKDKLIHVGMFKTVASAATAYNFFASELYGEFARMNTEAIPEGKNEIAR